MDWEGENIKIVFQPLPPQLMDINSCQVEAGPAQPISPEIEWPAFGPKQDSDSADLYFKSEVDQLPFKLNIGKEANLTQEQQDYFINLIYDKKEVFSLHGVDLGYCGQLNHMGS